MKISRTKDIAIIIIDSWEEYRQICNKLDRWLFRGQSDSNWQLVSSLERALRLRKIEKARWAVSERFILSDFQRGAHNYLKQIPNKDEYVAWYSLIQHYGGPTRFLDFTTSFYIASFFAFQNVLEDCAVWAINRPKIMKVIVSTVEYYKKELVNGELQTDNDIDYILNKLINDLLVDDRIITVTPTQINKRQLNQHGISIIPMNLEGGFLKSICGSFGIEDIMPNSEPNDDIDFHSLNQILDEFSIIKFILTGDSIIHGKIDLEKMNINYFSLFGGIDGLAMRTQDALNTVEAFEKLYKQEGE